MAEEGASVTIEGLVAGNPEPSISWYRAGRQLSDGPDLNLHYSNNQVKLTLNEVGYKILKHI